MGKSNDQLSMKLVNDDEFDEANLSDTSDEVDLEKVELHRLKVTKGMHGATGGCCQIIIYLMFWTVVMGASLLAIHIVAREDPKRQTVILLTLAGSWIALSNLFSFLTFIVDKYHAFNGQPRTSEALVLFQFVLGGIVGGWLGLCLTCYRPPGVKMDRLSGFICKSMFCSAIGIAINVVLIVRVIIPNVNLIWGA